jgi:hypothetical protein
MKTAFLRLIQSTRLFFLHSFLPLFTANPKETDLKGKPALRLYSSENDSQGAQLTKGNW